MRSARDTLIDRVRALLKEKDRTQSWLAEQADIHAGQLTGMLSYKDERGWLVSHVEAVAKAFNVPVWQLLADPRDVIPAEYLELMENYRSLDTIRKQAVDDIFAAARAAQEKKSSGQSDHKTQRGA